METNVRLQSDVDLLEAENLDLKRRMTLQGRSFGTLGSPLTAIAGYVVVPVVTMVLLHYVLILLMDARPVYLRLATASVSLLCGFALERNRQPGVLAVAALAIAVAAASVFGMSLVMHWQLGLPLRPQDHYERRELGEYTISIALAYILGVLVARLSRPLRLPRDIAGETPFDVLASLLAHNVKVGGATVAQRQHRWRAGMRVALSMLTAAGMVWTGFSKFLQ